MADQTVVISTDPALTAHIADTSNPHEVTAEQLALDVQVRNHQTGTTYTIALTDSGVNAYLDTDNDTGIAVTIPLNATVATPNDGSVSGANTGAGAATFTGVSGVVLEGIGVTVDSGIYSFTVPAGGCAFSMIYLGSDTWQVFVGASIITSNDITDATTVGKALLTAADAAAQRTALGLGTAATLNSGTAAGDVPVLGTGGLLPASMLPALAITDTFPVASEAAMLALTAEVGDVAIRSDLNKSFILRVDGADTLANWSELKTPTGADLAGYGAASRTGSVIMFDAPAVYNTPDTPSSGTVSVDLTGAVENTEALAYFNHSSEPTWPAGVTAVGTWDNSELNVVRFLYTLDGISAVINSDNTSGYTNPEVILIPTADISTTSTSPQVITGMSKSLDANSTYVISGMIKLVGTSSSGVKLGAGLTETSTSSIYMLGVGPSTSVTTILSMVIADGNVNTVSAQVFGKSSGSGFSVNFTGMITTGINPDTLTFIFGSEVSGQTTTISRFGSFFKITKL